ncbi:Uncharacterized protein SCF082_LOCUS19344 [Durusdinium trenchii]|uniref:Clathrin light chain n=1 Tax=Durusdinium trenchii TaxID=1381693 RepID=A0ABP0KV74_9DINO
MVTGMLTLPLQDSWKTDKTDGSGSGQMPQRSSLSRLFGGSPVGRRPQCGCGAGILSIGEWFRSLCEPAVPAEEPGHARLQRIHEERAREQAAEKARLEALRKENEQKAEEWQRELQDIEKRRAQLEGEDLEKDCLSYFATADLLLSRREAAEEAVAEEAWTRRELKLKLLGITGVFGFQ